MREIVLDALHITSLILLSRTAATVSEEEDSDEKERERERILEEEKKRRRKESWVTQATVQAQSRPIRAYTLFALHTRDQSEGKSGSERKMEKERERERERGKKRERERGKKKKERRDEKKAHLFPLLTKLWMSKTCKDGFFERKDCWRERGKEKKCPPSSSHKTWFIPSLVENVHSCICFYPSFSFHSSLFPPFSLSLLFKRKKTMMKRIGKEGERGEARRKRGKKKRTKKGKSLLSISSSPCNTKETFEPSHRSSDSLLDIDWNLLLILVTTTFREGRKRRFFVSNNGCSTCKS